jgi:putative membrane protein
MNNIFHSYNAQDTGWIYWHWHPDLYSGLLLFFGSYLLLIGPLNHLIKNENEKPVTLWQCFSFTLGCVVMLFALTGPIHELSDKYLFSAHMAQHIILTLIVPPLLLLGIPTWLLRPLIKPVIILKIMKVTTQPLVAFMIFNGVFVLWHFPLFYEGALKFHSIHIIEHLLFMATAVILWWPVLSPLHEIPRISYPAQLLYLVIVSISQTPLFGVITFSDAPMYSFYINAPRIWNISALADQQTGGVIMKLSWIAIFLPAICIVFLRWYYREESEGRPEFQTSSI